jgi:hypothetical protein
MTPMLASYLTGVLMLLLVCWANGMDLQKHWFFSVFLVSIWPLTFPIILYITRRTMLKMREGAVQNAGTK